VQLNTPAEDAAPLILAIEDEPGIADFIERGLQADGFTVRTAADGRRGLELALTEPVDLVVLDLLLPELDGHSVLTALREARPELPVIVLTALGEVEDRIRGLEAGAVDYLGKPFSLRELSARIRAQLRASARPTGTRLRAGDIELELLGRKVLRGGTEIHLTTTEFELLSHLVRHAGRVLTREGLLRAIWGYEHDPSTNVVDVYVGYLRRKLTVNGERPPITTIRSVGYRLDAPLLET
jgi:two-component system, OmpR family, response regulator